MDKIAELFENAAHETKQSNIEKAIKLYKEAVSLSGKDKRVQHLAHWGMGEIYLNNNEYEKAEHHLLEAIALAPEEPYYHYLLGCTYTYLHEIDKAIEHLHKAIEFDDSKDIYWGQLGWLTGFNKDVDKGIQYLKKSLSINPENTRALRDICMLYAKSGKLEVAMVCVEEAQKHDPHNEEISEIREMLGTFKDGFNKSKT